MNIVLLLSLFMSITFIAAAPVTDINLLRSFVELAISEVDEMAQPPANVYRKVKLQEAGLTVPRRMYISKGLTQDTWYSTKDLTKNFLVLDKYSYQDYVQFKPHQVWNAYVIPWVRPLRHLLLTNIQIFTDPDMLTLFAQHTSGGWERVPGDEINKIDGWPLRIARGMFEEPFGEPEIDIYVMSTPLGGYHMYFRYLPVGEGQGYLPYHYRIVGYSHKYARGIYF